MDHTPNTGEADRRIWISGALHPVDEARIHVYDHAVTVGDGVFETIEAIGGRPFALGRHLRRLRRSATVMELDIGYTDDELRAAVGEVLAASPTDRLVRLTVSAGRGPLGSGRHDVEPTVIVATATGPTWPETTRVVTVPWARNDQGALAGVKSTSYAENVLALRRAHEAGASEALFANTRGRLCEGTGTNVFVVLDGRLVTPPLSSGCLAGITRELLLELVDVDERDLPLDALFAADEVFLTSTTRDVLAVSHVDEHVVTGAPGPLTKAAATAFADLKTTTLEP